MRDVDSQTFEQPPPPYLLASTNKDLCDDPGVLRFESHCRFICLNLCDHFARVERIPFLEVPFPYGSGFHGLKEPNSFVTRSEFLYLAEMDVPLGEFRQFLTGDRAGNPITS